MLQIIIFYRELIKAGADVNAVNRISKTALIYAASENNVGCLEVLANAKNVDFAKIDKIHNDWNALHYAVLEDSIQAVKILVNAGANPDQKDGIGRTSLVIAEDHSKENVAAYLKTL
jgi:ankyrin repeat protein